MIDPKNHLDWAKMQQEKARMEGREDHDPLAKASALIDRLEGVLKESVRSFNRCQWCGAKVYLPGRQHDPDCALDGVFKAVKDWREAK